jgi:hypothetical protein
MSQAQERCESPTSGALKYVPAASLVEYSPDSMMCHGDTVIPRVLSENDDFGVPAIANQEDPSTLHMNTRPSARHTATYTIGVSIAPLSSFTRDRSFGRQHIAGESELNRAMTIRAYTEPARLRHDVAIHSNNLEQVMIKRMFSGPVQPLSIRSSPLAVARAASVGRVPEHTVRIDPARSTTALYRYLTWNE